MIGSAAGQERYQRTLHTRVRLCLITLIDTDLCLGRSFKFGLRQISYIGTSGLDGKPEKNLQYSED